MPQRPLSPKSSPPGNRARNAELLRQGWRSHQSGRVAEASGYYRQVLLTEPENPAANHLLGLVRLHAGDAEEAVQLIGRAIRANRGDPQYHGNLGAALNAAGRPGEALDSFARAITLKPDFPEAHSNRGMALRMLGRFDEATASYGNAIRLKPIEAGFHLNLANTLAEQGETREAEASFRTALRLRPGYPGALLGLASVLATLGRHDDAASTIAAALAARPDDAEFHAAAAEIYRKAGRIEDAVHSYRRGVALRPDDAEARRLLSYLVRYDRPDAEVEALERLFADTSKSDDTRMRAGFGLGKVLADIGEHQRSVEHFVAANALKRRHASFSSERAVAELAGFSAPFQSIPGKFLDAGFADAAPIFIVGLPRAGKTTVERLLSKHPQTRGCGELTVLDRLVRGLVKRSGRPLVELQLNRLPEETFGELGAHYAAHVNGIVGSDRRAIDTMPPNFRLIGFIRLALPNARIIHCVREPLDHQVAIFERHFSKPGYEYANDLDDLAAYYRGYQALMSDWRRLFPGAILDVDLGAMRADPLGNAQELLAFCGLAWDETCSVISESEPQLGPAPEGPPAERRLDHLRAYGDRLMALPH